MEGELCREEDRGDDGIEAVGWSRREPKESSAGVRCLFGRRRVGHGTRGSTWRGPKGKTESSASARRSTGRRCLGEVGAAHANGSEARAASGYSTELAGRDRSRHLVSPRVRGLECEDRAPGRVGGRAERGTRFDVRNERGRWSASARPATSGARGGRACAARRRRQNGGYRWRPKAVVTGSAHAEEKVPETAGEVADDAADAGGREEEPSSARSGDAETRGAHRRASGPCEVVRPGSGTDPGREGARCAGRALR